MAPLTGGTLAVDIGGTGVKMLVLDNRGDPLSERARRDTPRPASPAAIVETIVEMAQKQPPFERISVGFPGVVHDGIVATAPNLDGDWAGFALADRLQEQLRRPVRAANDADVQGLGVIEGRGVELVLTLGTGLGSALFVDGTLVPNFELAHHPFRKEITYEQYIGKRALSKVGKKKWSKRVLHVIDQIRPVWNCRTIYLGPRTIASMWSVKLPSVMESWRERLKLVLPAKAIHRSLGTLSLGQSSTSPQYFP